MNPEDKKIVDRWVTTGILEHVTQENLVTVARRLDAAADLSVLLGVVDDFDFIEDEIVKIRNEGLFSS